MTDTGELIGGIIGLGITAVVLDKVFDEFEHERKKLKNKKGEIDLF